MPEDAKTDKSEGTHEKNEDGMGKAGKRHEMVKGNCV